MRTALGFAMLIAFSCNRSQQTSNETIANGTVLSGDTGKSGDPASYTVIIAINPNHLCSGVLIHPRIVLTAGHCDVLPGDRVGKLNSQGNKMDAKNVSKVITNETYLKTKTAAGMTDLNVASDLSLLLLDSAYDHVRDILPKAEPRMESALMVVSGFGRNETNSIDGQLRAEFVNVEGINKPSNLDPYASIYVKKTGDQMVCRGDSGGPGVVRDGTLMTITSAVNGAGICGESSYSAHASVWHAMPWITANMNVLLGSSQNSIGSDPVNPKPGSKAPVNPNPIYVDNPPPSACSQAVGIFDVAPNVIRDINTNAPGLVCNDGNPQTPDPIIRCTSSVDANSCQNTGICLFNGTPIACTRQF